MDISIDMSGDEVDLPSSINVDVSVVQRDGAYYATAEWEEFQRTGEGPLPHLAALMATHAVMTAAGELCIVRLNSGPEKGQLVALPKSFLVEIPADN